jgi:hypothetical protein
MHNFFSDGDVLLPVAVAAFAVVVILFLLIVLFDRGFEGAKLWMILG